MTTSKTIQEVFEPYIKKCGVETMQQLITDLYDGGWRITEDDTEWKDSLIETSDEVAKSLQEVRKATDELGHTLSHEWSPHYSIRCGLEHAQYRERVMKFFKAIKKSKRRWRKWDPTAGGL